MDNTIEFGIYSLNFFGAQVFFTENIQADFPVKKSGGTSMDF